MRNHEKQQDFRKKFHGILNTRNLNFGDIVKFEGHVVEIEYGKIHCELICVQNDESPYDVNGLFIIELEKKHFPLPDRLEKGSMFTMIMRFWDHNSKKESVLYTDSMSITQPTTQITYLKDE